MPRQERSKHRKHVLDHVELGLSQPDAGASSKFGSTPSGKLKAKPKGFVLRGEDGDANARRPGQQPEHEGATVSTRHLFELLNGGPAILASLYLHCY